MIDSGSEFDSDFLVLPIPTFLPRRYRPGSLSNWSGHLAFANDLIANHRPLLLVELGTHYGESYFGMCQSVLENGIGSICYAVDHWEGEEHAGHYDETVFTEVSNYNQRFYKSFSYLLRTSFDEACSQFVDESIELLHLDGLHTYEAGMHDFQKWWPKIAPGGIVLFHDVMARHANFGVWKVWEELQARYHETFTFHHGWGLGVLRKPGDHLRRPKFLDLLFSSDDRSKELIRRHYVMYSAHIENLIGQRSSEAESVEEKKVLVQFYAFADGGYSEGRSAGTLAEVGVWSDLSFKLPADSLRGPLRFDPANCPSLVEISAIKISDAANRDVLLSVRGAGQLSEKLTLDSAICISSDDRYLIFCFGDDPKLILRIADQFPGEILIEVSLRIDRDLRCVADVIEHGRPSDMQILKSELRLAQSSRLELSAEISRLATDNRTIIHERDEFVAAANRREKNLQELVSAANVRVDELEKTLADIRREQAQTVRSLNSALNTIRSVETSISWRLTKPLRYMMRTIRGRKLS
jgi:hypothetical protein